jgi:predicted transcriptional regulator
MNVSISPSLLEFEENPLVFSTLKAIFELTNKQLNCFLTLRIKKKTGSCIKNLVENTNSERSIIQKHLKVLLEKGLVIRESVSLSEFNIRCKEHDIDNQIKTNKGYLFIYASISDEELLEKINEKLEDWKNILKDFLNKN